MPLYFGALQDAYLVIMKPQLPPSPLSLSYPPPFSPALCLSRSPFFVCGKDHIMRSQICPILLIFLFLILFLLKQIDYECKNYDMIMMFADLERGDATGLSGQGHYPSRSGKVMCKAPLPDLSLNSHNFTGTHSSNFDTLLEYLQQKSIV